MNEVKHSTASATAEEEAVKMPVGKEEIARAYQTLLKYKAARANLEKRIVDNQQWYKLRQWDCLRKSGEQQIEPVSAWLFNAIANKHADAMDNFPAVSILPREENDVQQAKMLSAIVPAVLDECDFESVYSQVMDDKLISGTGVYGVFWDGEKQGGMGDVEICPVDVINLFWESGVTDIQHSRQIFHVSLQDNDVLEEQYPALSGKLSGSVLDIARYVYDDNVDTTGKSLVVDWYYKKRQGGRKLLHYCKFVAGQEEPLFATENQCEPQYDEFGGVLREAMSETGWYDHGLYPFVFDPLFRSKGTPCGFGYIDVGKKTQEYIDRGDQAIMQNLLFNCRPRHFIRNDGSVNEEEYADLSRDFVHVDGALGQDSILPVRSGSLDGIYVTVINNKIDELKETTGNRDVSSGGTTGGATAAAAIAAMQEAGSKLSRDSCKAAYRAYKRMVLMVIELIRQFYSTPRCFRIAGSSMAHEFVRFSNEGIIAQRQLALSPVAGLDIDMGCRLPVVDVQVSAVKASPYSRMGQNELAMQFYAAGFFNPANAEAALACLEMMDFDRKDFIVSKIAENARLRQNLMDTGKTALELAKALGDTALVEKLAAAFGSTGDRPRQASPGIAGESAATKRARQRTAEGAAP